MDFIMNKKQKFETFLESLKGKEQDNLIETVKKGFQSCFEYYDDDFDDDFADPGGRSALRAASKSNPRIYPCPNCGRKNVLTRKDVQLGYQCDACADALERGGY
jgi:hypothetical protein